MATTELVALLAKYKTLGGVLDYVIIEISSEGSPDQLHRAAALAGIEAIDRGLEQWAVSRASKDYPIERFFRVRWDVTKPIGAPVPFSVFWGADDAAPKPMGDRAWSIPNVDGYKTAFFHPPHGLWGSVSENTDLFDRINKLVFGETPERAEIYSWSTDWSNYFDGGREWWGAFFWTIRAFGSPQMVVIGASSTD